MEFSLFVMDRRVIHSRYEFFSATHRAAKAAKVLSLRLWAREDPLQGDFFAKDFLDSMMTVIILKKMKKIVGALAHRRAR